MSDTATGRAPIAHRYDIVYFFDITDGNPNGDPDAGNLPRLDPETGQGLVTDVCLKRKIRNFVGLAKGEQPPFEIYVKERTVLNSQHDRAWEKLIPKAKADEKKKLPKDEEKARALTSWMCQNFFDIRTFGAVMTTEVNCGQVRGPIQFGIARSLHPIICHEHAVTRCAVTNERDLDKERTIGRKFTVPYGLYRVHAFVNPNLAGGPNGTGFSEEDLELFKQALDRMFESDRSAARATMRPVACIAFRHESPLGNARSDQLFARVRCHPKPGVQPLPGDSDGDVEGRPPRSSHDYEFEVDEESLPGGVTIERWIEWS
ncbi:type I-C CRISPR-associated protein Cas7/Csd2 [Tautonia sociabilis]|uniref:Type I-C CRISPR-associated protein Cas7/Csd2 n=1 Tax=Tautonia sociabilis TaxID=2080755 RepID=A0A432ME60_9BACT|nr:type I-C CRISPR-associated protein Cas7/Csd2 [Tautonia sociabilis]RUL83503.1 type I-C CRISPR-associated protein Cas7/Csd2 [Tautonia sociabilis]